MELTDFWELVNDYANFAEADLAAAEEERREAEFLDNELTILTGDFPTDRGRENEENDGSI